MDLEADLLKEDLVRAQQLTHRIIHGLEAGVDLVTTLAPALYFWTA